MPIKGCFIEKWVLLILLQVQELLTVISQAKVMANSSSQLVADQSSSSFMDWFGLGSDYSGNRGSRHDGYEEFGGGSVKRIGSHLEQALNNFCNIFQVGLKHCLRELSTILA